MTRAAGLTDDFAGAQPSPFYGWNEPMGELHHECGVAAVYHAAGTAVSALAPIAGDVNSVARLVPRMLLDMQNRGQLAAGMSSFRPDRSALIKTHKEVGTVAESFRLNHRQEFEAIMEKVDGPLAIGHVRYATCGGNDRSDAQPFERDHGRKAKWFAFAFNGQLANYDALKDELLAKGDYHLKRNTDTEIIMHSLAYELQTEDQEPDWVGVFGRIAERFDGAYNIVLITAHGELVVVRDPLGFRPLCIAEHGPLFGAASESVPLANLGFRNIRSLEPGTLAVAGPGGIRIERFAPSPRQSHCFFEWIYFANVASTLDDRSVYLSRAALGKELARLEDVPLDADTIVVPVPDTAKAAADAMAFALGVPSVEGLMRNRYVGRTFIEGTADRAAKARLKYTPLAEVLCGQASPPGRGQHRPLDDHAGPGARDPRPRRSPRDPRSRRVPADHRSLLLRHRHVAQVRALRHAVHRPPRGRRFDRRAGSHGQGAWCRQPALPSRRGHRTVRQPRTQTASAAPASPAATRPRPVSSFTRSRTVIPSRSQTETASRAYESAKTASRTERTAPVEAIHACRWVSAPIPEHTAPGKSRRPSSRYFRSKCVR